MALSPVKQNAIALRVNSSENGIRLTIDEVMKTIKRSRQTWYNWLENDVEFRGELKLAYDTNIALRVREELYRRLHMPNFPLDALVRLYLADKTFKIEAKQEIQNVTLADLVKRAYEEKNPEELSARAKSVTHNVQRYLNEGEQYEQNGN